MALNRNASQNNPGIIPRLCGPAVAGAIEMAFLYPLDVLKNRIQVSTTPFMTGTTLRASFVNLLGQNPAGSFSVWQAFKSLYVGLPIAAVYRISQRVIKFGLQAPLRELLEASAGDSFNHRLGQRAGKITLEGVSGAMLGVIEPLLLQPFDTMKVVKQVHYQNGQSVHLADYVRATWQSQGLVGFYKGIGPTMVRNILGSSTFFAIHATIKDSLVKDNRSSTMTVWQTLGASGVAAAGSILIGQPLDVVKSRLQAQRGVSSATAWQAAANMLRTEGPFSFFKGIGIKLPSAGTRMMLSFTLAQTVTETLATFFSPVVHSPRSDDRSTPKPPTAR
jgi:hypothetical protein